MIARLFRPLGRVAAMDGAEVRFRVRAEAHTALGRLRWRFARPRWRRDAIRQVLTAPSQEGSTFLAAAQEAARDGDWAGTHCALARHLVHQPGAFPLPASAVDPLAARIRARFPGAAADARLRADRLLAGEYDLLGYRGLRFGEPPDWGYDPAHQRHAPHGFWARVPYLDPASGDHKIIWEFNRHQHWLTLARCHALADDRRCYAAFVQQLDGWLTANPPLSGINWASMLELGFRSLSWLWAAHVFAPAAIDESATDAPWLVDLLVGLDRQLSHIEPNLSRYFSPNTHLSGEALALYVAGISLPWMRASGRRAAVGRDVLVREAERQVRADGGHAERSAHYHRYSTDFYLLALQVARTGGDPAAAAFEDVARRQARYLRAIADDSGRLPLIGDDDGGQLFPICGRAPDDCADTLAAAAVLLAEPALAVGEVPEEVFWRCGGTLDLGALAASASKPTPAHSAGFEASGYFVSRTGAGDHLVFDAGPHGFLNGGHAHADALAVVATVGGRPLLVDPGTATYTMDPAVRDRFRSTPMHNTVVVNGLPQSQPRGPFHWRTRADARASAWRTGEAADYAEGRHAAYAPTIHVRGVLALHGVAWLIVDHFFDTPAGASDAGPVLTEAFWHLHPDWSLASRPGSTVTLQHRDGGRQRLATSGVFTSVRGTRHANLAAHAPCYGRVVPSECLRVAMRGALPRSMLTVVPMGRRAEAEVVIDPLPLTTPLPDGWQGAAFRVQLDDTTLTLLASTEVTALDAQTAAPPTRWGSSEVQTVARVALLRSAMDGWRAVLVNGRHLSSRLAQVNHDLAQPLIELSSVEARPQTESMNPAVNLRREPPS
jgi:hypothetical protein